MLDFNRKLIFLFILYFAGCTYSYSKDEAQSIQIDETILPQDSLEVLLSKVKILLDEAETEQSFALSSQILNSAISYNNKKIIAESQFQLARIYNRWNEFEKSDSIIHEALSISKDDNTIFSLYLLEYNNAVRQVFIEKGKKALDKAKEYIGDPKGVNMVRYRYTLSDYYRAKNDDNKVLELLLLAKKEAPEELKMNELFNINYQLGALFHSIGVYDQSIAVGVENEKLAQNENNFYLELFAIYTQLNAHVDLNNHEELKSLVERAISIKEEHNISPAFGFVYFVQGLSFYEQDNLEQALHFFNLGETIAREHNATKELCENLTGKSKVYYKQGDYQKSMQYANEAKQIDFYKLPELEKIHIKLDASNRDYESAFNKSQSFIERLEKEKNSDNNYKIISTLLNDKFEAEKSKQQIFTEAKARRNKLNLGFGLLSALVLFLGGIAAMQAVNKQKLEVLNKTLVKRNEALTNFSYISSHDLKEPVRNIISFSELLEASLTKSNADEQDIEFTKIIKNSSNTLLEIVKSLKIFSETAFDEEIKLDEFKVQDVFCELSTNMHQIISDKNATLNFENPEQVKSITFSKPMLYLLLQNLIQNGLKYNSDKSPRVNVSIGNNDKQYLFKVTDNGDGIDSKKLEYIFKPFKTLQSKSLSQSSGLGLSICKNILDKFGGNIWVKSELGTGSVFHFTIPKN